LVPGRVIIDAGAFRRRRVIKRNGRKHQLQTCAALQRRFEFRVIGRAPRATFRKPKNRNRTGGRHAAVFFLAGMIALNQSCHCLTPARRYRACAAAGI
jgi:hypothetical protein